MSYPFGQSKMETTYSENIQKGKFYNGIPKTKLEKLSWTVQKSAYISLVRSILVYSAIIWDPYYIQDINKLESMQKQAARFITGDFKSHDEGYVTKMIHDLGLESLQELRSFNRLVFFYKVVEGWYRLYRQRNFSNSHVRNAKLEPKHIQALLHLTLWEQLFSGTIWKIRLCMQRQLRGSNQPFISATNSTTCPLSRRADTE